MRSEGANPRHSAGEPSARTSAAAVENTPRSRPLPAGTRCSRVFTTSLGVVTREVRTAPMVAQRRRGRAGTVPSCVGVVIAFTLGVGARARVHSFVVRGEVV